MSDPSDALIAEAREAALSEIRGLVEVSTRRQHYDSDGYMKRAAWERILDALDALAAKAIEQLQRELAEAREHTTFNAYERMCRLADKRQADLTAERAAHEATRRSADAWSRDCDAQRTRAEAKGES